VVPGDGGCALVPLFMTPARAKEYLLLAREYTASELARLGIINYAVPANKLDATVDDIVARLLKRPAYALAWAKRIANKRVTDHLNMTLDAASAYEQLNKLQSKKTQL
jgi:enoyl-CoA hydratase